MEIVKQGTWYVAIATYEEKDVLKRAGFRWDGELRQWRTPSKATAAKLIDTVRDPELRKELSELAQQHQRTMILSRGVDADIDIPCPEGLVMMPFQKAGTAYALGQSNTLIADDMGLGKTMQALGVINCLPEIKTVLVICPATLKLNWEREARKWLVVPTTIGVVDAKKGWKDANFTIINYDITHKYREQLMARTWDLLICDEAHYMKSAKARRTLYVLGGSTKQKGKHTYLEPIPATRKIFLTGTPIENFPVEAWTLFHALAPDVYKSFWWYANRFCGATHNGYGYTFKGNSNLDEFQQLARETCMVRRTKAQVLTELPPKTRQLVPLPTNGNAAVVAQELNAWNDYQHSIIALRAELELAKAQDRDTYEAAVAHLINTVKVQLSEISRLRHETALAKVPAVIEFLEGRSGKVVLFAHHRDVIGKFQSHFGDKAVTLMGGMSPEQKDAAVTRFQNDPKCEVFIGSIMAAGLGITLTAASHVVFAELDWTPGKVTQAEDRCHRIGQTDNVLVQHLVFDGSLDAKMVQTLVDKQKVIDAALDDDIADLPVLPGDEDCATKALTWKKVASAKQLTSVQIDAIHNGLQMLAGVCDGAHARDGAGFSMIDVRIGHSLANQATLTNKQAVLGQHLINKYQGQLPKELVLAAKEGN